MHFFDPSLDWPKDLLEIKVPNLLVVQSNSLSDQEAPWNALSSWSTPWTQYASTDADNHFIKMTFFDTQSMDESEKRRLSVYIRGLGDRQILIQQYTCTDPDVKCSSVLRKINVIECQWRQTSEEQKVQSDTASRLMFHLFTSNTRQSEQGLPYLSIEPVDDDVPDLDFSMYLRLDDDPDRAQEDGPIADAPSMQSNQSRKLKLYAVASS